MIVIVALFPYVPDLLQHLVQHLLTVLALITAPFLLRLILLHHVPLVLVHYVPQVPQLFIHLLHLPATTNTTHVVIIIDR